MDFSAIDGVLARKTPYGNWSERYVRTLSGKLQYYTSNLPAIKKSFDAEKKPYNYVPVGPPTESFRLMFLVCVEQTRGAEFFVQLERPEDGSIKKMELRCDSEEEAQRWVDVLRALSAKARSEKLVVGKLHFEIDGGFMIGKAAGPVRCEVRYPLENDGESPLVAASEEVMAKMDPDLLYENVDETEDKVARIPGLKLSGSVPVHAASAAISIALVRTRGEMLYDETSDEAPSDERLSFVFGGLQLMVREVHDTELKEAPVVAHRAVSLFEVREMGTARFARKWMPVHAAEGHSGRSAIDSGWDVASFGPDGTPAASGWGWFALFAGEGSERAVRGFVHAKMSYSEDLIATFDGASERIEAQQGCGEDFDMENVTSVIARLKVVGDLFGGWGKALDNFFKWKDPSVSLAGLAIVWMLAYLFPSAGLAIFPLLLLMPILCLIPARCRAALGCEGDGPGAGAGGVARQVAMLRIAIVEARGLCAADENLTTTASSDPYVAIVSAPAEPPPEVAAGRVPMLLGMTETHNGNLNPVFDRGDSPTLACPAEDDMWSASYCAVSSVGGLLAASPGAVDATLCTKSRVRDVGDRSLGECAIPSVDFRAEWALHDGRVFTKSAWHFPVLQQVTHGDRCRAVPWKEGTDHLDLEVFDADVVSGDDFMGKVRFSIADLARNPSVERWFALEPSGAAKDEEIVKDILDATLKGDAARGDETPEPLGALYVKIELELPEPSAPRASPAELRLITGILEKNEPRYKPKASGGMMAQYKEMQKMMTHFQNQLNTATAMMERAAGLLTWEHPVKTGGVVFGLACGVLACRFIPSGYLIALAVTYQLCDEGSKQYALQPGVPHEDYMIVNALTSLPSAPQKLAATAVNRELRALQEKRLIEKMRLHLRLGSHVGFQGLVWTWLAGANTWTRCYAVVANGKLVTWKSCKSALKNAKPLATLTLRAPVQQHAPKKDHTFLKALAPGILDAIPSEALSFLTVLGKPHDQYIAVHQDDPTKQHPISLAVHDELSRINSFAHDHTAPHNRDTTKQIKSE